jgi:GNAT superfamily N-acetyltransferase
VLEDPRPAAVNLVVRTVSYTDDVVRALEAEVQSEYVSRYGGPDRTPIDPEQFAPPDGCFLVGWTGPEAAACGGLRRHDPESAEVKRMFVPARFRGRGYARLLLAALETQARSMGYSRILLETGTAQPEAISLYVSSGYHPVPGFGHYRDSPMNRCFAKDL